MSASTLLTDPIILLGTGGLRPGLIAYDIESARSTQILSLPQGHSVYAADWSPDGATIALGTRAGDVHRLRWQHDELEDGRWIQETRIVGGVRAPILAIRFVNERTIAVSDTAQRCLLWRLEKEVSCEALPTEGRTVCAFFRADSAHLAGLALSGELLLWDGASQHLCQIIEALPLPHIGALVNPVYWSAVDAWVWPAMNGTIVFYQRQTGQISTAVAHHGDVYAVTIGQSELLTIGRVDGQAKHWSSMEGPTSCTEITVGILSAASWLSAGGTKVVLVDEEGTARVYWWHDGDLAPVQELAGMAYRIAVSPDLEAYQSEMLHHRARRAKGLMAHIQDMIARCERADLEPSYEQLTDLGYRHVALGLRAEQARTENDSIAELKAYHELVGILPIQEPASERSLARYAELLVYLWQPRRALAVYDQLQQVRRDGRGCDDKTKRLLTVADIMANENHVIESTIPTTILIQTALVLGEEVIGRYLLQTISDPIRCGVNISATDLVHRYEQASQLGQSAPLPAAEHFELWWLSAGEPSRVMTVVFSGAQMSPFPWLELGVKFFDVGLQTVLVPVAILNASAWVRDVPVQQRNQILLEELCRVPSEHLAGSWLEAVYRHVKHAIRQVMTRALAERI
jgi:hypothetical protein